MPIFVPPALYYGGIAALGAGARAINSPTGQNIVRGGINLFNKGVNKIANTTLGSLPQYAQSLATGTKFAPTNTGLSANVIGPVMTAPYLADPKADEGLRPMITDLMESLLDSDTKDTEKKDKKKKKEKKDKKKETKENKEPSIDDLPLDAEEAKKKKNLKKGGYVKKQRKRKPYKSSSFAKMKKSKKRKYI